MESIDISTSAEQRLSEMQGRIARSLRNHTFRLPRSHPRLEQKRTDANPYTAEKSLFSDTDNKGSG